MLSFIRSTCYAPLPSCEAAAEKDNHNNYYYYYRSTQMGSVLFCRPFLRAGTSNYGDDDGASLWGGVPVPLPPCEAAADKDNHNYYYHYCSTQAGSVLLCPPGVWAGSGNNGDDEDLNLSRVVYSSSLSLEFS